jgi:hypothetical protein
LRSGKAVERSIRGAVAARVEWPEWGGALQALLCLSLPSACTGTELGSLVAEYLGLTMELTELVCIAIKCCYPQGDHDE